MNKVPNSTLSSSFGTSISSPASSPSFFHQGACICFRVVRWACLALAATGLDLLRKSSGSFPSASFRLGASVVTKNKQVIGRVPYQTNKNLETAELELCNSSRNQILTESIIASCSWHVTIHKMQSILLCLKGKNKEVDFFFRWFV